MKKMKKGMKPLCVRLCAARWWNPLFWVSAVLVPLLWGLSMAFWGCVFGVSAGFLDGLSDGLDAVVGELSVYEDDDEKEEE